MNENLYKLWEEDVVNTLKKLKIDFDKNEVIKENYKGFSAWYSNLIFKPKLLLIGINPGTGYDMKGKININPDKKLSYLHGYNNFRLAEETIKVFKDANLFDILEKSTLKTNYHYILTKGTKELNKCIKAMSKEQKDMFMSKSTEWTSQIIEMFKPEYILCEGKRVYDNTTKLFNNRKYIKWENDCGYCLVNNKNYIMGYSRRYSNIRNKKALSKMLKQMIN